MRNIVLLAWGPPSLYYAQPRERLKVRTRWQKDGPLMPCFLGYVDEDTEQKRVKYCFSAFEDLNSCIRNLRWCFGFPYQEYIGFLNTFGNKHRARREHADLLPGLRLWARSKNVDAVVWVDYARAKAPPFANPPGVGLFSAKHLELCEPVVEQPMCQEVWQDDVKQLSQQDDSDFGGDAENPAVANEIKEPMAGGKFNKGVLAAPSLHQPVVRTSPKRSKRRPVKVQLRGSIWERKTLTPGPGYYNLAPPLPAASPCNAPSFGSKAKKSLCDRACESEPGPGSYDVMLPDIDTGKPATFDRFRRFRPDEVREEAELEIPESFSLLKYEKPPTYSFSKTARPFCA